MAARPQRVPSKQWRELSGAPKFITARGLVVMTIKRAMDQPVERAILAPDADVRFGEHGSFRVLYAGDDFALLEHYDTGGRRYPIFIPPQMFALVSDGRFYLEPAIHYGLLWGAADIKDAAIRHRTPWANVA